MSESMFDLYVSMVESMEEPDNELMHKGVKGMKWKNHVYANWKVGAQSIKNYARALKKKLSKKLKKFGKGVKKHAKGYYKYTVDRTTDNIGKGVKKVKKGAKSVKNRLDGTTAYNTMNKEWNKRAREISDVLNKHASEHNRLVKSQMERNKKYKSVKNPGKTASAIVETGVNATAGTKRLMDTRQGELFEKRYLDDESNKDYRNFMAKAYAEGWNTSNYQNLRIKGKNAAKKAQPYKKKKR